MISPFNLHRQIVEIIRDETRCSVTWDQHPEALTSGELRRISERVEELLNFHTTNAVTRENAAPQPGRCVA